MLASLLPGIREVRAPLVAGTLLLTSAYIALLGWGGPVLSLIEPGPGSRALIGTVDSRTWWASATIAAYLVGSLYVRVRSFAVRNLAASRVVRMAAFDYLYNQEKGLEFLWSPLSRPSLRRLGSTEAGHDAARAAEVALNVIFSNGRPLLAANEKLYVEYDRLRSEAELRDAVGIPLFILALVAMGDARACWLGWALAVVVVGTMTAVLLLQARSLDREANSTFAHAVADGILALPTHRGRRMRD